MKNQDFIHTFVYNRNFEGHTNSLTARNAKLFSYNTCIAQHAKNVIIINNTRYSVTTSRHQHYLRTAAIKNKANIKYAHDIPMNAQHLTEE